MAAGSSPAVASDTATDQGSRYGWFVVACATVLHALNYVDRQIVTIVAIPIKADLGLSNTEIGLISGLAFAIFYAVFGLPLAWIADRWNRVSVLSLSLLTWSAMTAVCGLAQNFGQLFAARVGVGVGEAGCTPPAQSLISDYVPKERRAFALSIYSLGIPIGSFIGLAVGGVVTEAWGWRAAFMVVGLPGVAIAILLPFLVKEPRRAVTAAVAERIPGVREVLADLSTKKSYWHLCIACSLTSMLNFGSGYFLGFFFNVKHDIPLGSLGLYLGLVLGIGWIIGILAGGFLADSLRKKYAAAYALVPAFALLAGFPFAIAAYLVENALLSFVLLVVPTALNSFVFGPGYAVVQSVTVPRSRALALAIFLLIANLVGLGLGPVIVGALTDFFSAQFYGPAFSSQCVGEAASSACRAAEAGARSWALIVVSALAVWSAAHLFLAARTVAKDSVS
ncbi:spinster family MFS transporter [Pelagerythrobacter sp.]|uniref:spinster family MFS transporter n=1 Tax=Pelagerythrobacter sp. TaxID=2800702 RepID=UPI0035ADF5F8